MGETLLYSLRFPAKFQKHQSKIGLTYVFNLCTYQFGIRMIQPLQIRDQQ